MKYELRPYQREAVSRSLDFFASSGRGHGLIVLGTGTGKSLVIADTAHKLGGNVLILQPNQEILLQNYEKLMSYGVEDAAIYSASLNKKDIGRFTFATIGSLMSHMSDFDDFRHVIIDEAHEVNPSGGRYATFINAVPRKVLGLTATPYKLASIQRPILDPMGNPVVNLFGDKEMEQGCILRFLTRMKPRTFERVVYYTQAGDMLKQGYLAPLTYYDVTPKGFGDIKRNSTGMDYDTHDVDAKFNYFDIFSFTVKVIRRLYDRPDRKHILVFAHDLKQAEFLTRYFQDSAMVSGETPRKQRRAILDAFKRGEIRVVFNVGVLVVGFDFPALDTMVFARPTMSLAIWYQAIGRVVRPFPGKDAWVVDICGTMRTFGRVENLMMGLYDHGKWAILGWIENQWKQLTNVFM